LTQFLLIRFKLLACFIQFSPLLLDLDETLFNLLLLSLIGLFLFSDPVDPPSSHLTELEPDNLFLVAFKYLLS
jgi:hypothetical protein